MSATPEAPGPRIRLARPDVGEEELDAIRRVFASGMLTNGVETGAFEQAFAARHECEHAVAFANGTVALAGLYLALGIGPGDDVIVPSFTFISTATSVLHVGANPVFADIDPETFNLDPADVARRLTPATRAIVPVHYGGQPADLAELKAIADDAGAVLLEDAAEAHGATYRQRPVGTFGLAGMFSFTPTKNITTGEGGLVTTNDGDLSERLRLLRNHGQASRYDHPILGYNWRMTEMQAAMGQVQLTKLDNVLARKRDAAQHLTKRLDAIDCIAPPVVHADRDHVFMLFTTVIEDRSPRHRARCPRRHRASRRSSTSRPPTVSRCSGPSGPAPDLPVTDWAADHALSLPMHTQLSPARAGRDRRRRGRSARQLTARGALASGAGSPSEGGVDVLHLIWYREPGTRTVVRRFQTGLDRSPTTRGARPCESPSPDPRDSSAPPSSGRCEPTATRSSGSCAAPRPSRAASSRCRGTLLPGTIDPTNLAGCDAVVHLAGRSIGAKRWSADEKRELVESRTRSTALLAETLAGLDGGPPRAALGLGHRLVRRPRRRRAHRGEQAGHGLPRRPLPAVGGSHCARRGGRPPCGPPAHRPRARAVRAGSSPGPCSSSSSASVGASGSGRQWWSWIAMEDEVRAIRFLLDHELDRSGQPDRPRARSPTPSSPRCSGGVLHRPTIFPAPGLRPPHPARTRAGRRGDPRRPAGAPPSTARRGVRVQLPRGRAGAARPPSGEASAAHLGCMRMPPSTRMVSAFM